MAAARAHALLEGGVAETVVGGALLRVLQHLVGEVDLLEADFRLGVARIAVGVELHGELAESRLENLLVGAPFDAERFVKVRLRQEYLLRNREPATRQSAVPAESLCPRWRFARPRARWERSIAGRARKAKSFLALSCLSGASA